MNRSAKTGLILIIIGVAALYFVSNIDGRFSLSNFWSKISEEINTEKTVSIENIDQVDISTSSIDVTLTRGSGDQARIRLEGRISGTFSKDIELHVEEKNDKLVIGTNNTSGFGIGIGYMNVDLIVELPEKNWNDINVNTTSGNIKLDQLQSIKLTANSSSGNIASERLQSTEAFFKSTSGNVKIEQLVSDSVELKSTSGNISAYEVEASDVNFNSTSGNVKLTGGDMAVEGKTTSGDIKLEINSLNADSKLSSSSGNVKVNLQTTPSDLAVEYNGSSGNGKQRIDGFTYTYEDNDNHAFKGNFGAGSKLLSVKTSSGNFTLQ